jgi:hypothetical protein
MRAGLAAASRIGHQLVKAGSLRLRNGNYVAVLANNFQSTLLRHCASLAAEFQGAGLQSKFWNKVLLASSDSSRSRLTPSVLNSRQFLSHTLDVPVCPEADAHATDTLQLRRGYLLSCDIALEAD